MPSNGNFASTGNHYRGVDRTTTVSQDQINEWLALKPYRCLCGEKKAGHMDAQEHVQRKAREARQKRVPNKHVHIHRGLEMVPCIFMCEATALEKKDMRDHMWKEHGTWIVLPEDGSMDSDSD
ncbi:hypothetical protein DFP72DRAFT_1076379 [Ephemerocybe angulata]|uniref:Uncharacterized protein n=1 Tax=Ephemerocybe angulata TaxID=980116 RepID=A0A8H6HG32_9AGAR|nr:hypothetical protein DFP72DRAFT_1076379 [Tulosesus angulatus]